MRRRLILLAHGSLDPLWRQPFIQLTADLQSRLGMGAARLAFMEFGPPTLLDEASEAVRDGWLSLAVLPLFLAAGVHLSADIPALIAQAGQQFPQLHIELLPPIGQDRRVQALFKEIACEYLAQ